MTTLFKIDSKNKLRVLNIWTEGPVLKRTAGVYRGSLVPSEKVSKPKNVGRANATTAEEQAVLEAQSEVNKKMDEGYVEIHRVALDTVFYDDSMIIDFVNSMSSPIPKPMLAKSYTDKYADYEGGVLVSAKLDGMRCLAEVTDDGVMLWSRGSKPIETMPHITSELERLNYETGWTGILDGELYVHSENKENFQDIMKACKKYRPGVSEQVEYHVYDTLDDVCTAKQRTHFINVGLINNAPSIKSIRLLEQHLLFSEKEVMDKHTEFLAAGYEGTMVKNANSLYRQDARSSDLLKLKDFMDEELLIIDVLPMENKPLQGMVILQKGEHIVTATPKFSHEERERILRDKHELVGQMGKISYFSLTDDGRPRFPIFLGVRETMDIS